MATYIDEALIKHAIAQTSITDIVSRRIYHIQAPQDAQRPYVVLNLVVGSDESEQLGVRDFGQPLFQWTCVSKGPTDKTPADAFLVAHAIKAVFRDLSGTIQGIAIKYTWSRGPVEFSGVGRDDDVTCVIETEVHYEGI